MAINIELPFNVATLPMQTNQYQAYSTGILMSSTDSNIFDWISSHSLRIRSVNEEFSCYHPGDCPQLFQDLKFSKNDCFIRHSLNLPNEYLEKHKLEILKIIEDMLTLGFYVHGDFNEYYIPARESFQKENLDHDYLLTGFDFDKKEFSLAGYNNRHSFRIISLPYENYVQAVFNKQSHYSTLISFYKVGKTAFCLDWKMVYRSLHEFVMCSDNSEYYEQHCSYGKNALKRLPQVIKKSGEIKPFLVAKNVRGYFEHICFFLFISERMQEALSDKKIEHLDYFRKWYLEKSKYMALAAKYVISENKNILDKIIHPIEDAIIKECEMVNYLLQSHIWSSSGFSSNELQSNK